MEAEEGIPCWEESSLCDEEQGACHQRNEAKQEGDSPCWEAGMRVGYFLHALLWVEDNLHEGACTPGGCELGAEEDSHEQGGNMKAMDGREEDEASHSLD